MKNFRHEPTGSIRRPTGRIQTGQKTNDLKASFNLVKIEGEREDA